MSIIQIRAALETALSNIAPLIPATPITSVAVGPTALFTTATPHGLISGMPVKVLNYIGGDSPLTGLYNVIVLSSLTFNLQNSATKSNIGATIAGNSASIFAMLTAYQNMIFPSIVGVPYQIAYVIPFKPEEPTQGVGYYQEHGVFQVTLVYPVGIGVGAIAARAEVIRSAFKKGSTFVNSGLTVTISDTPELGNFAAVADSFSLPVKISYLAHIYS